LRFKTQPIPLPPSVCDSGVVAAIIGQVYWPHYTGIEVRSYILILQSSEVRAIACVGIHRGREGTSGLVCSDNTVVGDNTCGTTQEGPIMVLNKIVLKTSAHDITTTTKPAEKGGVRSRSQ
jgi:hypothetical protein